MLQAVWQEMYQRRKSVDDSLIMTNKWSHAMLPAELFWGQTEFKWEKKIENLTAHLNVSVINEEYRGHSRKSA